MHQRFSTAALLPLSAFFANFLQQLFGAIVCKIQASVAKSGKAVICMRKRLAMEARKKNKGIAPKIQSIMLEVK